MPRPYKVISCSTCGTEPANPRDNRAWSIRYKKHHKQWPGYINPDTVRRQSEARMPDEPKAPPTMNDKQFGNPGLWDKE